MLTSCRLTTIADDGRCRKVPAPCHPRGRQLFQSLGWRIDADLAVGDIRAVQLTPSSPGVLDRIGAGPYLRWPSPAPLSVWSWSSPTSTRREDISSRCVRVNEVFHREVGVLFRDPTASSSTYASSAIRTATAGCCKGLQRGFRAESGRTDSDVAPTSSGREFWPMTSAKSGVVCGFCAFAQLT
jgi:hypothetical protein